ncbi:hypothetical protein FRC00_003541 [Tulasnella sp. 408]|nr:hypothetical protein FRC00_003541 [Tulasnella sp. 408]
MFDVDPNSFRDPRLNIQYSLDVTGSKDDQNCQLLGSEDDGKAALCYKFTAKCKGVKVCWAAPPEFNPHVYIPSKEKLERPREEEWSPSRLVFEKTFGLYVSLLREGCTAGTLPSASTPLPHEGDDDPCLKETHQTSSQAAQSHEPVDPNPNPVNQELAVSEETSTDEDSSLSEALLNYRPKRDRRGPPCGGKFVMRVHPDSGASYVWDSKDPSNAGHYIIRNLHGFDVAYLKALLKSDEEVIREREEKAEKAGYGPLAPCQYVGEPRQTREFCVYWHRDKAGKLRRGELSGTVKCPSTFTSYVPYDLQKHPKTALITAGAHIHPPPRRTKTPPIFIDFLNSLLFDLDWRVADATPRRLSTDLQFTTRLRHILNQNDSQITPTLASLHPSFSNLDHIGTYIKQVRILKFPFGTNWEGAQKLKEIHDKTLPSDQQYIRLVKEYPFDGSTDSFRIILCMFPQQSDLLRLAKWLVCDTSFKRVKGWKEFGIELWESNSERSMSVCRAFITSESAEAHRKLFEELDAIVKVDTAHPLRFHYMDGEGWQVITMDEHKGQALGFGLYLSDVAQDARRATLTTSLTLFRHLSAYEHLAYIWRLCVTHYRRRILGIAPSLPQDVVNAMHSLASPHVLQNFDELLLVIRGGGKKAIDWLEDKITGSPFALPGIYRPKSKIPLDHWLAANYTTNGIEQKHADLNRDGKALSLLSGIMLGFQYDARSLQAQTITATFLMFPRHKEATVSARMQLAIRRQGNAEKKRALNATKTGVSPQKKKARTTGKGKSASQPGGSQGTQRPKATALSTAPPTAPVEPFANLSLDGAQPIAQASTSTSPAAPASLPASSSKAITAMPSQEADETQYAYKIPAPPPGYEVVVFFAPKQPTPNHNPGFRPQGDGAHFS